MRPWEGIDAGRVDDPVLREQMHRIHLFLQQVSDGIGNVQKILGIEGSESTGSEIAAIPTVHDNYHVQPLTEGILAFGATDVPGRAHPILVNSDGEVLIDQFPGVTMKDEATYPQGGYPNVPAEPAYASDIHVHMLGKMETSGINPSNAGRMTIANCEGFNQGFDLVSGTREYELPTALVVQPTPKIWLYAQSDFNGKYYLGSPLNATEVVLADGSHNPETDPPTGDRQGVWRFTRGMFTCTCGVLGTPPGLLEIRLYGYSEFDSTDKILLRQWDFDPTSWIDNGGTKVLRFDVEMPFMSWEIEAPAGSSSSHYYEVANGNMTFFGAA